MSEGVGRWLLRAIVVATLAALAFGSAVFALSASTDLHQNDRSTDQRSRVALETANVQNLRQALLQAGPFRLDELSTETQQRFKALRGEVRELVAMYPSSQATEEVERIFREYGKSLDEQIVALKAGDLGRAVALAPERFDGNLALLRTPTTQNSNGRRGSSFAASGLLAALFSFGVQRLTRRRLSAPAERTPDIVLEHNAAIVFATDRAGRVTFANQPAERFFVENQITLGESAATPVNISTSTTAYAPDTVVGTELSVRCSMIGATLLNDVAATVLKSGRPKSLELVLCGDTTTHCFDVIAAPLWPTGHHAQAEPTGVVWDLHDSTIKQTVTNDLQHKAFHDHLTGLPNRALFRDRAAEALELRAQNPRASQNICVMFIDLDGFKNVNDSLGHEVGDELIVEVAFRLSSLLRPTDTIARLGGDEFAVLIVDPRPKLADLMAERVLASIQQPIRLRGRDIQIGASIGLAEAGNNSTVEELLRDADTAMYAAKDRGKNRVERFHQMMFTEVMDRLELNTELRRAAEQSQLRLMYQPIVELHSQRVVGIEALLRWQHPQRGVIPPSLFIPMAEESGAISAIGRWVLRNALSHLATLPPERPLRLNVNVSARQLEEPDFVEFVATELARSGISPSRLSLEITESLILDDIDTAIARLDAIRELGVRIAIDDFGTGYSSLSYLKRLPVDQLKIDKSFISDGLDNEQGSSFVRAIIDLANTLGLTTVAEGVENDEQMRWLLESGCMLGQGYLFSRPMALADLTAALTHDAPKSRALRHSIADPTPADPTLADPTSADLGPADLGLTALAPEPSFGNSNGSGDSILEFTPDTIPTR